MSTEVSLRRAIRLALGGAVALSTSLAVPPAFAQDQDQDATEEVVVIGSRIARGGDFQSPSPVLQVDRESIEKSGYSNLQQLLEKIPANGNGAFSTRGNNQDSTANGAASISLRGLGADATLVLVNGRRVSVSPFAENVTTTFVDINSIPVAAIERVEVLKDGASAVYGSDAVAGVVNIVLRKDYQGLELGAGFGNTTESGYEEQTLSAIWGTGGDDSNVTVIFDYFKTTRCSTPTAAWPAARTSLRAAASTCVPRGVIPAVSSWMASHSAIRAARRSTRQAPTACTTTAPSTS